MSSLNPPGKNLWIGNCMKVEKRDLEKLFKIYGSIESIRLMKGRQCAFVNFREAESAVKAMKELQGTVVRGDVLKIAYGKVG